MRDLEGRSSRPTAHTCSPYRVHRRPGGAPARPRGSETIERDGMTVHGPAGQLRAHLMPVLERRLRAEITGGVLFDAFSCGRYATDASHYQVTPLGIVLPKTVAEAERVVAIARAEGVSVLPRGGGTSQCGQTVNASLVV